QKALAAAGIASRRTCEEWITQGKVRVNGQIVTELGTKVDLETDQVMFNGRRVRPPLKRYYIALNKPRGVVSSRSDPHAGRLVTDLVDIGGKPMLRPVGRLDADSEGLIFLTDDGDFLYKLTHPRYHVPKTYRVQMQGVPTAEKLERLRKGIMLDDGLTRPAENVRLLRGKENVGGTGAAEVELTIYEGRNRQVRRMFAAVGHTVTRLTRVRIGSVRLTGLPPGAWRHLTAAEIAALTAEISSLTKKTTLQEENKTWPEPPPSTPPKASSSPISLRTTRPLPQQTLSNSPKKGSTTV
ncbi:MAG: rRNA pseudouridine synthase, partial [Armatimonadota bacterium]|nr:rRNA pseudouridine synthase [Armatimonadota bacterium]